MFNLGLYPRLSKTKHHSRHLLDVLFLCDVRHSRAPTSTTQQIIVRFLDEYALRTFTIFLAEPIFGISPKKTCGYLMESRFFPSKIIPAPMAHNHQKEKCQKTNSAAPLNCLFGAFRRDSLIWLFLIGQDEILLRDLSHEKSRR